MKIKLQKRQKERDRCNTFSKRKAGVFKKASELCTFPGTEISMILFSPTAKPYSFGHPNIESIINRFFDENSTQNLTTNVGEADDEEIMRELDQK